MINRIKDVFLSILILVSPFIALTPVVLSDNYLRQDDLMWEIWPGMKMADFGYLYYNTVFQLVRPLCMLSFYITDLISIDIHHAIYIRFFSLIMLGVIGILVYRWQLFFNSNRILSATFAISIFTLPAYQIFAATGNYSLIISALLLTVTAMFSWHKKYFWLGCFFYLASLLDYPLSSMFAWLLLLICYLNISSSSHSVQRKFFYRTAFTILAMMLFYYIFSRVFHFVFQVDLASGRATVLDMKNMGSRLLWIVDVLFWHADFWFWNNTARSFSILIIGALFFIALCCARLKGKINSIINYFIITFLLFFLAYSPILATSERVITFRYALTTMPILLYVVFWSLYQILPKIINYILLIGLTGFGMVYANWMTADGIVGPHQHDFDYIQTILSSKVMPLLQKNKKVVIHAIACDEDPQPLFQKKPPFAFEYGMRTCQYQQQVIGVIIHSLRKLGYASNYNTHNVVIYNDKEIIVRDTPWGTLVVNSRSNPNQDWQKYVNKNQMVITIDTRAMQPYQPFEFYRKLKFANLQSLAQVLF